jgi:hypothetical protein
MNDDSEKTAVAADQQEDSGMIGARVFVSLVFTVLGVAFISQTIMFYREFQGVDWQALLLLHSHLFLFFPAFGVLALVAFHLPATIFTHMYWTIIPHGRLRFVIGALVIVAAAIGMSRGIDTTYPTELWQLSPRALVADRPEEVRCDAGRICRRVTLLEGVRDLRRLAQTHFAISKTARPCSTDELLEEPDDVRAGRYCFAGGEKLGAQACCAVQSAYRTRIADLGRDAQNRSALAQSAQWVQPFETFFVMIVVAIGALLVIWRRLLEANYADVAPAIERALLIGAAAMMPWPFMDYAFSTAMETLTGRMTDAPDVRWSLVVAPWALLLLIFFLGRMGRKVERLGQLAGAAASVVAVLRYQEMTDVGIRVFGVGAPLWLGFVMAGFIVLCFMMLRWPRHLQRAINGVIGRPRETGAGPPPGFRK